ncbi:hypothetical protein IT411_03045 [Candidatus Peregrinibacteria bacterium]|nr:hypothetical protein [Candidatus Peregrinibacteria bacterium]
MFKKLLTIGLSLYVMTVTLLPCLAFAASTDHGNLLAVVTLDNSYKPDNSPGVLIDAESMKGTSGSAVFANFLLQMLAGGLITIAAPVAVVIIAIAGLIATVSHGNDALISKAKKIITWTVIGLIVIIFSWIIVQTAITIVQQASPGAQTNQQQPGQNTAPGTGSAGSPTDTGPGAS